MLRMRCLAALMLLVLATDLHAAEIYIMPYDVDPPIVIDGQLDDWANVPHPIELRDKSQATYMPQHWDGPADLSGIMRLAWRNGLYIAADVVDDVFQQPYTCDTLYRGDHVNLWLDLQPTGDPDRTTLGEGQYHIAVSPGNLAKQGVIPAQVVIYLPTGATTANSRVAARRTESGYIVEAFVSFADLRVEGVQQDHFAAFEVAISDSDDRNISQQCLLTSGTAEWQYLRTRMRPMVFGSGRGTAQLVARTKLLIGALSIPKADSANLQCRLKAVPPGYEPYLFFRGRHAADVVAGYAGRVLVIEVNDRRLDRDRLSNRSPDATMQDNREQNIMTGDGRITLPSAPDFEATDADPRGYALCGGVKAAEYEFYLGGLLRAGDNMIKFDHVESHPTYTRIHLEDVSIRLKPFTPGTRRQRGAPTGELPVYEPQQTVTKSCRDLRTQRNVIHLTVEDEPYRVESTFSTPDGQWREGSNDLFNHTRKVVEHDEWIEVHDTWENLTGTNLPLMQRHRLVFDPPADQVWLCGIKKPFKTGKYTRFENPSVLAMMQRSGVGLIPLNDVFRVHAEQSGHEGQWVQLADPMFVLEPGATYTAEWMIVPAREPDYFTFVNAARRSLDVNFTLPYCSAFVFGRELLYKWNDASLKTFLDNKSVNFVVQSNSAQLYKGRAAHGTPFFEVPHDPFDHFQQRIRRIYPDGSMKTGIYCHWFLDTGDDSPTKFHDARGLDAAGRHIGYSGPDDPDKVYIPTLENNYGKAISRYVEVILDKIGADGIYNDEFAYSRQMYVYNMWDKYSADIDPKTHQIKRLKGAMALLSLDFRHKQVNRILNRGAPFYINGMPATRTMTDLKFQAFVETGSGPQNAYRTHLYSPVMLGDHLTEHTYREICTNMVTALNHGCLYALYYIRSLPNKTLTEHMFPFTPIELHAGYVIGKERILTATSGVFGWGDDSDFEWHVFGRDSKETNNSEVKKFTRDGKTYAEVRIPEGYSVAIVRRPPD